MIFRQKQMRLSLAYIGEYNLGFRFTTIWGGCIRGCHWKIPLSSIAGAFELWWKIDFGKTDLIISQPQNDIYLCLVLYEECIVEAVRLLLWLAGWWLSVVDMRRSPKQIFSSYGIPWIRVRLSILIAMFPFPPFFRGDAVSFTRCSGINNKQATKQWVSSFKRSCLNQHPVKAKKQLPVGGFWFRNMSKAVCIPFFYWMLGWVPQMAHSFWRISKLNPPLSTSSLALPIDLRRIRCQTWNSSSCTCTRGRFFFFWGILLDEQTGGGWCLDLQDTQED